MKPHKYILIITILGVVILALGGGLIYTNSIANARVNSVDATLEAVRATKSTCDAALYREQIKNVEMECNSKDLADALSQAARLKMKLSCPMMIFDVDYSSDETVASDLKDFIRKVGGDLIESNDWNTVFGDPNPTLHRLYSNQYMWAYVVYKSQNGRGTNAIFDLANSCWLDLSDD
jgi:hypothetical protein